MATGADIVSEVRQFLGDPYVYGGEGPNTFDCSGLVQYVYAQKGMNVPRTSSEQWKYLAALKTTSQDKGNLMAAPGDLIFSQWPGDDATPGHIGIYIGGHQLIEAPKPGGVVQVATIDQDYFDHIYGVGHVPALDVPAGTVADNIAPGSTVTAASAGGAGNTSGGGGGGGGLFNGPMEQAFSGNLPSSSNDYISGIMNDLEGIGKVFYTLTLPSTWARVASGILGVFLLGFGLWQLGKEVAA